MNLTWIILIDNAIAVRELLPSYSSNHDFLVKPFIYDYSFN